MDATDSFDVLPSYWCFIWVTQQSPTNGRSLGKDLLHSFRKGSKYNLLKDLESYLVNGLGATSKRRQNVAWQIIHLWLINRTEGESTQAGSWKHPEHTLSKKMEQFNQCRFIVVVRSSYISSHCTLSHPGKSHRNHTFGTLVVSGISQYLSWAYLPWCESSMISGSPYYLVLGAPEVGFLHFNPKRLLKVSNLATFFPSLFSYLQFKD